MARAMSSMRTMGAGQIQRFPKVPLAVFNPTSRNPRHAGGIERQTSGGWVTVIGGEPQRPLGLGGRFVTPAPDGERQGVVGRESRSTPRLRRRVKQRGGRLVGRERRRAIAVLQVVPRDSLPQLGSTLGVAGDLRFGEGSGGVRNGAVEVSGTTQVLRRAGQHVSAGTSGLLCGVGHAGPDLERPLQIARRLLPKAYTARRRRRQPGTTRGQPGDLRPPPGGSRARLGRLTGLDR